MSCEHCNAIEGMAHAFVCENNKVNYDGNGYAPGIPVVPLSSMDSLSTYKNKCHCPMHGPTGVMAVGCRCNGI